MSYETAVSTVVAVITILAAVLYAVKRIAPLTATTIDDRIVSTWTSSVDRVEAFTKSEFYRLMSDSAWHQVELAAKSGTLPPAISKSAYYLMVLHDAWIKYQLSVPAEKPAVVATFEAAGLSAAEKLNRVSLANLADPRPAPGA